ncbi:GPCR family 2 secretin-like, partial [Trinorchestia longiramus]
MARATLMVVPLFGLQFLLTIYRPGSSACRWITYYNILNHVIEGSTGMLVAVIFCYMNSEVRALLKRSCRCLTEELEHRGFPRMHESIQMRSRYSMSTVHTLLPDTHAST